MFSSISENVWSGSYRSNPRLVVIHEEPSFAYLMALERHSCGLLLREEKRLLSATRYAMAYVMRRCGHMTLTVAVATGFAKDRR